MCEAGGRSQEVEVFVIYLFNIALLRMMACSFFVEPNAIVCRIRKSHYYPIGDFLHAQLGKNVSYTRLINIHSNKYLLCTDVCWKVGDGKSVTLWGSPWINDDVNFYIGTACLLGLFYSGWGY